MTRTIQFITGIVLLTVLEVARLYFIMPLPGSHTQEAIDLAYFINDNIFYFRTIGWLIILFPTLNFLWMGKPMVRLLTSLAVLGYFLVFYLFNNQLESDEVVSTEAYHNANASTGTIALQELVVGLTLNGQDRAYHVELFSDQRQLRDTVGGEPVLVVYCREDESTWAYRPMVNTAIRSFTLLGVDYSDGVLEDGETKTWWRVADGKAVAGPLKERSLPVVPSMLIPTDEWLKLHPGSMIYSGKVNRQ